MFIFKTLFIIQTELHTIDFIAKDLDTTIAILIIIFLMIKLCFGMEYSMNEIIVIMVIGAILFFSGRNADDYYIFYTYILAISLLNIKSKNIVKIDYLLKLIFIMLTISLAIAGIINNSISIRPSTQTIRYALGFRHPNLLGGLILSLSCGYLYTRKNKLTIINYLAVIFVNVVIYIIADSRTSILLCFIYIISIFIIRRTLECKSFNLGYQYSYCLFALTSVIASVYYSKSNAFLSRLNQNFNGRIRLAKEYYQDYGLSLLGQNIKIISVNDAIKKNVEAKVLDNAYMHLGIRYGVIVLILICIGYAILIKKLIAQKEYILLASIICFAIYGLFENYMINLYFNFTLILMFQSLTEYLVDHSCKIRVRI